MAIKTEFDLFFEDNVAGSGVDLKESPIVPNGKKVIIREFGGSDPGIGDGIDSIIALQWGSGGSFVTMRAGTRHFNFDRMKPVVGDGSKRFRLVRLNKSAIAKPILAWVNAILDDS